MPALSIQHVTIADALAEVERGMISAALRKHGGNISRAARELGLTRRGLQAPVLAVGDGALGFWAALRDCEGWRGTREQRVGSGPGIVFSHAVVANSAELAIRLANSLNAPFDLERGPLVAVLGKLPAGRRHHRQDPHPHRQYAQG